MIIIIILFDTFIRHKFNREPYGWTEKEWQYQYF